MIHGICPQLFEHRDVLHPCEQGRFRSRAFRRRVMQCGFPVFIFDPWVNVLEGMQKQFTHHIHFFGDHGTMQRGPLNTIALIHVNLESGALLEEKHHDGKITGDACQHER